MGKEVLINHMYNGDFLKKDNLGHEIINLFKCDNGEHYVYAMSAGDYAGKHKGLIKTIIMVRNIDEFTAEVLAKADVKEDVFGDELADPKNYVMLPGVRELENGFMSNLNDEKVKEYLSNHEKQLKYIKDNKIKYGGVWLNDIFSGNRIDNLGHTLYITFKVENFRKPKKTIYLCDNRYDNTQKSNYFKLETRNRMCGASQEDYFNEEDKTIKSILDESNWEKEDTSEKVDIRKINKETSILDVLKKRNEEIIYSNWIAYCLKNDFNITKEFVSKVLKVNTNLDKLQIVRESNDNIDIWIEDEKSIIVIENKIKSAINGTQKTSTGITVEEQQFSQLSKYYDYTSKVASKYNKKAYFFLLLPNYAYNNLKPLEKYRNFKDYTVIRYSDLYEFFNIQKTGLPYYDQFVLALASQSYQYSNDLYVEMLNRFKSAIQLSVKEV